jgi:hypothetical protein
MDKQVKVGDKVKATEKAKGWSDITPGNVYFVQRVSGETGTVQILDDVSDRNVLTKGEYELIPQPQTFKAGDRVRIVKRAVDAGGKFFWAVAMTALIGEVGTVQGEAYANGAYPVKVEGESWEYCYLPESLELVTEEAQPEPQQQDIYLVSGFASEFPTIEAAEQHLASGWGKDSEKYRIAKLVKTVRVSRVTTTTLEAV